MTEATSRFWETAGVIVGAARGYRDAVSVSWDSPAVLSCSQLVGRLASYRLPTADLARGDPERHRGWELDAVPADVRARVCTSASDPQRSAWSGSARRMSGI